MRQRGRPEEAGRSGLAHRLFIRNNAKLWTNIAYVISSFVVVHQEMKDKLDATVFLVWLAVVSGAEIAKRIVAGKMGVTAEEPK